EQDELGEIIGENIGEIVGVVSIDKGSGDEIGERSSRLLGGAFKESLLADFCFGVGVVGSVFTNPERDSILSSSSSKVTMFHFSRLRRRMYFGNISLRS